MTKRNNAKRNYVYREITSYIIKSLKKGVGPWICPYERIKGPHRNAFYNRPYRGINILLLNMACWERGFRTPLWVTFKEARRLGGHVKRGAIGTKIIFWKFLEVEEKDPLGQPVIDEETGKPKVKKVPFARTYYVFNVEQCEGLPNFFRGNQEKNNDPWETAELLKKLYGLPKVRQGYIPAYYPLPDVIEMPPKGAFKSPDDFWATFLHELTHWTGHESRLNRKFNGPYGSQSYAMEELIAEMGAAFIGAHTGLPIKELQHPEYISGWLKVLEKNSKAIFTAARLAQEACDWLLARVGMAEKELKEAA